MIFHASDSTGLLIDLFNYILLFCGIWGFYAWHQLRGSTIPERFSLLGKDLDPKKCLDQEMYVSYMRPRVLVFAIVATLLGVLTVLDAKFDLFAALLPEAAAGTATLVVGSLLPFVVVIWFGFCIFKIQKDLWP